MLKLLQTLGVTFGASAFVLIILALAYIIIPVLIVLTIITVIFLIAKDHFYD